MSDKWSSLKPTGEELAGVGVAIVTAVALVLATVLAVSIGLEWLGIERRGFFGPKRAEVEREIFEQTRSYVHGKQQDLARFRHEWMLGDDTEKKAIESTIRVMFAEIDPAMINDPDLRAFLKGAMQ